MACAPSNIGRHRKVSFAPFISKQAWLQASHFDGRCAVGHGNGGDESSPRQAQFRSEVESNSLNELHASASTKERSGACGFHISWLDNGLALMLAFRLLHAAQTVSAMFTDRRKPY
jgi:hypothetical protein